MTGKIIAIEAGRERRRRRRGEGAGLVFRITKDGCLEVDQLGPNGAVIEEYEATPENTKALLAELSSAHRRWSTEQYYLKHPEQRPKPDREKRWRICKLWQGRGNYDRRCVRRLHHKGAHRGRDGIEFVHFCAWTKIWGHGVSGTLVRCACGKVKGQ